MSLPTFAEAVANAEAADKVFTIALRMEYAGEAALYRCANVVNESPVMADARLAYRDAVAKLHAAFQTKG